MKYILRILTFLLLVLQCTCKDDPETRSLILMSAHMGPVALVQNSVVNNVPPDQGIVLQFSSPVSPQTAETSVILKQNDAVIPLAFSFADQGKSMTIQPTADLLANTEYVLAITSQLRGAADEVFAGAIFTFRTVPEQLKVSQWTLGGKTAGMSHFTDVPLDMDLQIEFSKPLNTESVNSASVALTGPASSALSFHFSDDKKTLTVTTASTLRDLTRYTLVLSNDITGASDETFTGFQVTFYTAINPNPDFPVLPDEDLLTLVEQQTFKYFWDFAQPTSGLARERNTSGDVVTTGGSGFGIMALIVGIERNFISREQGLERMDKILTFLETADRFHGAWPHWMNGNTGDVVPFSANDNGGDLVETSFLLQGLLTFRQYLNSGIIAEKSLIDRIDALWHTVEWDWYTRGGEDVLYWHWSPDKEWIMNFPIRGYNEALITYFLAAASPAHAIPASAYQEGWADNGAIVNNKTFYGITLPLGPDYGGPLFFAHYSFLGLDPRNLSDKYASYWTQNVNHTLINHAHAVANPHHFVGYSDDNWGFTASDDQSGYSAHSPTNDAGVITPTAALSSMPYTPDESMRALKFFYYTLGDRLWGPYGFYDAFNITEGWTADSYLAIDEGPIIIMIENYRTGLLWDLFMSAPEVQVAMDKLGFSR
jgi:hypothetical protein